MTRAHTSKHLWELRAETSMDLGDHRRAVEYGRKLYEGIPRQWNLEGYARIHATGILALALTFSGDRTEGLARTQELVAVSTAYPYTLLKTDKQVFLARNYMALGDYAKAYEVISEDDNAFFRGLADAVSGGATLEGGSLFAFQQIQRDFMRHKAELETGRIAEAKVGYDDMLAAPATRENGDLYWIVLYDRGRIAEREGNAKEAIDFYMKSVEVIERQRSSLNTEASKIGFIGSKQQVYQDVIRLLVAENRHAEAFEYVERSKARALVDMLAAKKDFMVQSGNVEQVRALLAMSDSAEAEARVLDAGGKGIHTRSLIDRTRSQHAEMAPELASLVSVTTLGLPEVQQRLKPSEALIEYYYGAGRNELFAFVVTSAGVTVRMLDGARLAAEIQEFRKIIGDPHADGWREPAQRLHNRLIGPLESLLGEGRITIIAHGALHYLPFNALFDGRGLSKPPP